MLYSIFNEFHVTPVFENSIKQSRCMKEIIAVLYNTSKHDDLSYEKKKYPTYLSPGFKYRQLNGVIFCHFLAKDLILQ
jgi:hypothetical protein